MGSEGLPDQFSSLPRGPITAPTSGVALPRTGAGSPSRSCAAVREAVGPDFIIIYRLSMLDLVEDGQTWDEVVAARPTTSRQRGATIINTRHRLARGARADDRHVPFPRGAFTWVTAKLRPAGECPGHHVEPNQTCRRPLRRSSRAAMPTWCRWLGRSSPIPTG